MTARATQQKHHCPDWNIPAKEVPPSEHSPQEKSAPEPQTLPEQVNAVIQKIAEIDALSTNRQNMTPKAVAEFIRSKQGAKLLNPESLAEIKSELEAIMPRRRQFK